jgi:low affinity Fe/Cu permease
MNRLEKLSNFVSKWAGTSVAFICALVSIIIWLIFGPFTNYSDTWQLTINTSTTIITFLMVFLIQRSQNRDIAAVHIKLDEIIRAMTEARNEMISVEELSEKELERLHRCFLTFKKGESRRGE